MNVKKILALLLLSLPMIAFSMQRQYSTTKYRGTVVDYFTKLNRAVIYAKSPKKAKEVEAQILKNQPYYTVKIIIAEPNDQH